MTSSSGAPSSDYFDAATILFWQQHLLGSK